MKNVTIDADAEAETRFLSLMVELFQMNEATALDFGIHRVIRHVNGEVAKFFGEPQSSDLSTRLKGGEFSRVLDSFFHQMESEATAEATRRLSILEGELGFKAGMTKEERQIALNRASAVPAARPLVEEYVALAEQSSNTRSLQQDRRETLNHLYQFFSRHYQDGDFIVERRYTKDGSRYVKSTGEDTEFHWATEGMYYIKSGDVFTDFPITTSFGKRIIFTVEPDTLRATRAALQPNDKAHYELSKVVAKGDDLIVHLKYLRGSQTEQQRLEIIEALQTRGIFDSAQLRRYLALFIARNQSDFFIHQRLGDALRADLDIYVKTEVLDVDQILQEALARTEITKRAVRVARAVSYIAKRTIDFVSEIENFKKALWEKRKLVLSTDYIVTLDRLARYAPAWLESVIDRIVEQERSAWRSLGLGDHHSAASVRAVGEAGAPPAYLPLPVDTRNFDSDFKWSLLESVTSSASLDSIVDGIAIRSDNWQALNTLELLLSDRVKCVYIDPPYNTDASGIPYKNGYRDASWITMMENRVRKLHTLLRQDGAIFVSISKVERTNLQHLLDRVFGSKNHVEELIWVQNAYDGKSPTYSTNHEYVEVYARNRARAERERNMFREPKPGYADVMELIASLNAKYPPIGEIEKALRDLYEDHKRQYREEIEASGLDWESEKRNDPWKGLFNYVRAEYRDHSGRLVAQETAEHVGATIWVWRESDWTIMSSEGKQSPTTRDPEHPNYRFYDVLHPITNKPCAKPTRGWKGTKLRDPEHPHRNSLESLLADDRIAFGPDETKVPQQKRFLHEVDSNVAKSVFVDYSDGEKQTTAMFGRAGLFLAPKHSRFVARFIEQSSAPGDIVLDCFGGSGSTAQAVIELNHITLEPNRKFIVIETNQYFETLIVPRLIKAGSSTKWDKGKARALNGPGLFMRVQRLEQYEDSLENLDASIGALDPELPFDDPSLAIRYALQTTANRFFVKNDNFRSPNEYTLRCLGAAGNVESKTIDLNASAAMLLGLDVDRLYRETGGTVMLGTDRRGRSVGVLLRNCEMQHSQDWVESKIALHGAEIWYCNAATTLSFTGAEHVAPIEMAFAQQFNAI